MGSKRGRRDDESGPYPADPETARHECIRWYYTITPPASLIDGAAYDWPGPDYDTTEPEPDPRHYKAKNRGE